MRVLVVDADDRAAEELAGQLTKQGHQVRRATTAAAALAEYEEVELVLLDMELPDLDGIEACRRITANGQTPVISFTSSSNELERVLCLQAGADDCIVKPCGMRELLARMGAVLRRTRQHASPSQVISRGPLQIDPGSRQVRLGERTIEATRKEFDLLHALALLPGSVLSRKELMARVWADEWGMASRTIDTHVSALRSKLGHSDWIVTVRGVGYRLGAGGAV